MKFCFVHILYSFKLLYWLLQYISILLLESLFSMCKMVPLHQTCSVTLTCQCQIPLSWHGSTSLFSSRSSLDPCVCQINPFKSPKSIFLRRKAMRLSYSVCTYLTVLLPSVLSRRIKNVFSCGFLLSSSKSIWRSCHLEGAATEKLLWRWWFWISWAARDVLH